METKHGWSFPEFSAACSQDQGRREPEARGEFSAAYPPLSLTLYLSIYLSIYLSLSLYLFTSRLLGFVASFASITHTHTSQGILLPARWVQLAAWPVEAILAASTHQHPCWMSIKLKIDSSALACVGIWLITLWEWTQLYGKSMLFWAGHEHRM